MNTTLSPVTVQRFSALQGELIVLVEMEVYRHRGYAQGRGVGQPEAERCALACAFAAKAVLDLKTTRALMDRLQAHSKLRRLCGFDLRFALPSEATFSRDSTAIEARETMAKKEPLEVIAAKPKKRGRPKKGEICLRDCRV